MPASRQIVALGGGGFSMEDTPVLDDYVLGLSGRERPCICFVPTASGDSEGYIERFYERFKSAQCEPVHLSLFRRNVVDLEKFCRTQDVFYVGGGNVANLLAIWRLHGFDRVMRGAYERGAVMAGVSAGSLCWFEHGVTDSFGEPELSPVEGLGWLSGSNCPHYDGEANRRPAFQRLVAGGMPAGVAADDGVGLHFVDEKLERVVSSRPGASAYRVELTHRGVEETLIGAQLLAV